VELFLLTPFFKGKTEGDQLFKIFEVLGSFTPLEAKEYKAQVPFDSTLFRQFEGYPRKNLEEVFKMVTDRKNFIDLILKMLNYSPSKRISAAEALKHPFFGDLRKQDLDSKSHTEVETEMNSILN
jgi:glycogen synthase kinase 3 beta